MDGIKVLFNTSANQVYMTTLLIKKKTLEYLIHILTSFLGCTCSKFSRSCRKKFKCGLCGKLQEQLLFSVVKKVTFAVLNTKLNEVIYMLPMICGLL